MDRPHDLAWSSTPGTIFVDTIYLEIKTELPGGCFVQSRKHNIMFNYNRMAGCLFYLYR